MFETGFLGTRADFMTDVVMVSQIVIFPAMIVARRWAQGKRYSAHRNMMIGLTLVLAVAVSLFEVNMNNKGGFFKLAEESSYFGTPILDVSFWIHMVIVSVTSTAWLLIVPLSFWKFDRPPEPNSFSAVHRKLGWVGLIGMTLTVITGAELYVLAFVL